MLSSVKWINYHRDVRLGWKPLRVRASQTEWEYSWIGGTHYEKIRRLFELVVLWASYSSHQNRIYELKVEMSKKIVFSSTSFLFPDWIHHCFMLCANQSLWFCVYVGKKGQIDLAFGPITCAVLQPKERSLLHMMHKSYFLSHKV